MQGHLLTERGGHGPVISSNLLLQMRKHTACSVYRV